MAVAGCAHAPPPLASTPVPAPRVAPLPIAPDASTFAYARARRVAALVDRVGAHALLEQAAEKGIDLTQLDPSRTLAVVAGDPSGGLSRAPIAAVVPVAPTSMIATLVQATLGPTQSRMTDAGLVVAINQPPPESDGPLFALARAPLDGNLELFVNAEAAASRFSRQIGQAFDTVRSAMDKAAAQPAAAGQRIDPHVADATIHLLRRLVDTAGTITLSMHGEGPVGLELIARDRGAAPAPALARDIPPLVELVPKMDLRVASVRTDASWVRPFLHDVYGTLRERAPDLEAKLMAALDVWTRGDAQVAVGMSLDAERLVRARAVMFASNAQRHFEALRENARLMADPRMKAALRGTGLDSVATLAPAVRKASGWPVDRYHYESRPETIDKLPPGSPLRAPLQRGFDVEIARVGEYLVYTVDEPAAVLDGLVADLIAGRRASGPLAARAAYGPGGTFYGDLDVAALVAHVAALVGGKAGAKVPALDPSLPPLTLFAYSPPGLVDAKLDVPAPLFDAILAAIRKQR